MLKKITFIVIPLLLFTPLFCSAESVDLDGVTMSIVENEQDTDHIIVIPNREIDWAEMLEKNGITQQEYEDYYDVFLESQNVEFGLELPNNDIENSSEFYEEPEVEAE